MSHESNNHFHCFTRKHWDPEQKEKLAEQAGDSYNLPDIQYHNFILWARHEYFYPVSCYWHQDTRSKNSVSISNWRTVSTLMSVRCLLRRNMDLCMNDIHCIAGFACFRKLQLGAPLEWTAELSYLKMNAIFFRCLKNWKPSCVKT